MPVNSTTIESPIEQQSVDIPVLCPICRCLFPEMIHTDHGTTPLTWYRGKSVPSGKIYPLSIPEQKAMEEYMEEALKQGYIRHSTSPAASRSFFVVKKDKGLRPCIYYRALNKITVKIRYPFPLIPAALEQLRGASILTKLAPPKRL